VCIFWNNEMMMMMMITIIIIIIIMFMKGQACFLFLNSLNAELNPICHLLALLVAHHILHVSRIRVNPQDEVGPSISSLVAPCSFVLLVDIVVLVLVVCLCPSSVHDVATFTGTVLFPLLCSVLQFFCLIR